MSSAVFMVDLLTSSCLYCLFYRWHPHHYQPNMLGRRARMIIVAIAAEDLLLDIGE
jgi:hypothetical protein